MVMAGLRYGLSRAFVGLIVAELLLSPFGLPPFDVDGQDAPWRFEPDSESLAWADRFLAEMEQLDYGYVDALIANLFGGGGGPPPGSRGR